MDRTPLEQAIWETEYNLVNYEVELELLKSTMGKFKGKLVMSDNKQEISRLNDTIKKIDDDIFVTQEKINYSRDKLHQLSKKK